jgi:hypothetical protein
MMSGGTHIHGYCYDIIAKSNRKVCPTCKGSFTERRPSHIGEEAVERAQDHFNEVTQKRKAPTKGKGKQAAGDDEDEDELEDEEDGEREEEEGDDVIVEETDARARAGRPVSIAY